MTGKGLAKRILLTLALTAGFFVLLTVEANATPIRPDLQKLLAEPEEATLQFTPARAGWQGPEISVPAPPRATASILDPSASARSMRATLVSAAIPDIRVAVLIGLLIVLLRLLRRSARPAAPVHVMAAKDESPPAKAA